MDSSKAYNDFVKRLEIFIAKNLYIFRLTLSNIFTMRLIGNKTHGDLAELGISEFVNQYMYDFRSQHVGKENYRKKSKEEDILIINEITKEEIPISLKAYGEGPLQLSTDKNFLLYPRLEKEGNPEITSSEAIRNIFRDEAFSIFSEMNVLNLIYDEKEKSCDVLLFDYQRAQKETSKIVKIEKGKGRRHPIYRFENSEGGYIFEIRYGGKSANALQRGLWSHTKNGKGYFRSLTGCGIKYEANLALKKLFSYALVCSEIGHLGACEEIRKDIERIKRVNFEQR